MGASSFRCSPLAGPNVKVVGAQTLEGCTRQSRRPTVLHQRNIRNAEQSVTVGKRKLAVYRQAAYDLEVGDVPDDSTPSSRV